jgi:hypothetical protein
MKCFACGYERRKISEGFIYIELKTLYDENTKKQIRVKFYLCKKCGTVITDYNQE